jgi:hypothetical protein
MRGSGGWGGAGCDGEVLRADAVACGMSSRVGTGRGMEREQAKKNKLGTRGSR